MKRSRGTSMDMRRANSMSLKSSGVDSQSHSPQSHSPVSVLDMDMSTSLDESFDLHRLITMHESLKLSMQQDNPNTKTDILDKHIHPITMRFKDKSIENEFWQRHAWNQRKVIYIGYVLLFIIGSLLILFSCLIRSFKAKLCLRSFGQAQQACESMFSVSKGDEDSTADIDAMIIAVLPYCGFLLLAGICIHAYIHKSPRIENKALSLVGTLFIYALLMCGFAALSGLYNQVDSFWMMRLFGGYTLIFLVALWFSGLLFWPILFLCIIGSCFYYGFSIPVIIADRYQIGNSVDTFTEIEPTFEIVLFGGTASLTFIFSVLMVIGAYYYERTFRRDFLQGFMIHYQQEKIIRQKTKREQIGREALDKILPSNIVKALEAQSYKLQSCKDLRSLSNDHDGVSVLHADIAGFTAFANQVDSCIVMNYVNTLFERFDGICDSHNVYKIETVGDCYVAAVGIVTGKVLMQPVSRKSGLQRSCSYLYNGRLGNFSEGSEMLDASQRNTEDMVYFAKKMVRESRKILKPVLEIPTELRIGIHTGPCMSGVVGTKKMRFSLFGETVNISSWMEQNGLPNAIHASDVVFGLSPQENWVLSRDKCGEYDMESYILNVE